MVPRAYSQTDRDEVTWLWSSCKGGRANWYPASAVKFKHEPEFPKSTEQKHTKRSGNTVVLPRTFLQVFCCSVHSSGPFFPHMFNKVINSSVCWSGWSSWLRFTFSVVYFPVLGSSFGSEEEKGMSVGRGHFLSTFWLLWWPKSNRNSSASPGKCRHGTVLLSKLPSLPVFIVC